MQRGRTNSAAFVGILILLLPISYVGAYLVALQPGFIRTNHFIDQLPPEVFFPYRRKHPLVGKFFWPLELVDRRLRISKWEDRGVPVYFWSERFANYDRHGSPFDEDHP